MKSVLIRSLCIQSERRKMRIRKTLNTNTFHAVYLIYKFPVLKTSQPNIPDPMVSVTRMCNPGRSCHSVSVTLTTCSMPPKNCSYSHKTVLKLPFPKL